MPPESWSGNEFATSSSPTTSSISRALGESLRLRHTLDLEPEGDVVDHAAVREQPEVLEDHRDGVPAQLAQLLRRWRRSRPVRRSRSRRRSARSGGSASARASTCPSRRDPSRRTPRLARPRARRRGRPPRSRSSPAAPHAGRCGIRRPDHLVGLRAEDLPDATRPDHGLDTGAVRERCRRNAGGGWLGWSAHAWAVRPADHRPLGARVQAGGGWASATVARERAKSSRIEP